MRRRRLIRRAYRSGTMKKSIKPILVRVMFVILVGAVTAGAALLLGSYLDKKAQTVESLLATEEGKEPSTEKKELFPDGIPSESDVTSKSIIAAHIDVVGVSETDVEKSIRDLGEMYNAISVNVVSPSGSLVYLSDAVMEYVRLDGTLVSRPQLGGEDLETEDMGDALPAIKKAIAVAEELNMRKSVVFSASVNVLGDSEVSYNERVLDGLLLGELYEFGFDEVIITSLVDEEDEITTELLKKIVSYIASLREHSKEIDIGVMLPDSVYLVPQSASFIKSLSEYADFLAISVVTEAENPDQAYSSVYDNCHSLKGNFSVYNIRGVITVADTEVASAVYAALDDLSVKSIQFTAYVPSPDYELEIPVVTPDDTEGTANVNENAKDKEDYSSDDNE